jgi:hypothetical protein
MFLINQTKVRRKFSENLVASGIVTDVYRGNKGRILVEFETTEGWLCMSDPSHLEIIDEVQSTVASTPRKNDKSDFAFLRNQQKLRA